MLPANTVACVPAKHKTVHALNSASVKQMKRNVTIQVVMTKLVDDDDTDEEEWNEEDSDDD